MDSERIAKSLNQTLVGAMVVSGESKFDYRDILAGMLQFNLETILKMLQASEIGCGPMTPEERKKHRDEFLDPSYRFVEALKIGLDRMKETSNEKQH